MTSPSRDNVKSLSSKAFLTNQATLRTLIRRHAGLPRARSQYGHASTLLHYAGSNGVETHRQVVPYSIVSMVELLLEACAEVDAPANMYGGGSTTLALVVTSAHPANAGVVDELTQVLIDAGARRD